jgi:hypothetical protein
MTADELGPGARADDLVPGDADEVERLAARLNGFASAADDAAGRLAGLDAEHWSGRAADLFRAAVGPLPRQLGGAAGAFAAAARALSGYAAALRDGQSAAAAAVRLVERSTPDSAGADRETARQMVERARAEVSEAARSAAARLAEATADAPAGSAVDRSATAVRAGGTAIRAVPEHRLARPDDYVAPMGDLADNVHFGHDGHVAFAGGAAHASWQAWAAGDPGRGLGRVEPGVLAGLGLAVGGLTMIGRRRRDRTALAQVGIDDAELRQRAERRVAGDRGGAAPPARIGRLGGAEAWRTGLASAPGAGGTVHAWAGPEANPLPRTRSAEAARLVPADRQVSGVVPHTGPPANEEDPGAGAR